MHRYKNKNWNSEVQSHLHGREHWFTRLPKYLVLEVSFWIFASSENPVVQICYCTFKIFIYESIFIQMTYLLKMDLQQY